MTRKEFAFWFIAGVLLCASLPAPAQGKSEEIQRLELIRDIVDRQGKSIDILAQALAAQANKPPVVIGGMVPQAPTQVIEAEKPCEDSLIGCALRGLGSILLRAGNKGIDFLDRNAVPLLQVVATDRAAARNSEAAIRTAEFGYLGRRDVAQAYAATNQSMGLNLQNVALAGFGTIGALPPQSVTTNNISGTGINFGSGTLTYTNGSYNPTNPAPRVCYGGTATTAPVCF